MQTKPIRETNKIVKISVAVSVFILILLLISLYTTYTTPQRQSARQYEKAVSGSNLILEIIYPEELLMMAPAELMLNLTVVDSSEFTQALSILLDLPPSIVISGTVNNPITFEKQKGNYQQEILVLRNSGTLFDSQDQVITVTYQSNSDPLLLPIKIESVDAAARRQFFSSVLSDNGPFLLASATLVSIVGLILQQIQRQGDKDLAEREQERLRIEGLEERDRAAREEKQAQQKRIISKQVINLRRHLTQGNRSSIEQIWKQLEGQYSLTDTISTSEYTWLKQLVKLCLTGSLVNENGDKDWIQSVKDEWLDELVGALIGAGEVIDTYSEDHRILLPSIPISRVTDLTIRNRFIRLSNKINAIPLQNSSQDLAIRADAIKDSALHKTGLCNILSGDPLLHDRSEDEETALFEHDGFWVGHPCYSAIANATHLQVVYGASGCGRTALAKGLCYNESRWSRYFWVYQYVHSGITDIAVLRSELVKQLLQYILDKPTLFLPVQENTRRLLSMILLDAWPKHVILANLEQASNGLWLDKANMQQRPVWQAVGETQLSLLIQSVETLSEREILPDHQWIKGFCDSIKSLDYHGVRLVLDFAPDTYETMNTFLPMLLEWQHAGLVTTLFFPDQDLRLPGLVAIPLHWSQEQLDLLVSHRFLRLARCDPPTNIFTNHAVYNDFIQAVASGCETDSDRMLTPRDLIQLWQVVLENMGDRDVIDKTILSKSVAILQQRVKQTKQIGRILDEVNPSRLITIMDELFNDDEVRNLCVSLDVDYDNLGSLGKINKIRELVLLINRQGRLLKLVALCRKERSDIAW